jgi:hypothetical protein
VVYIGIDDTDVLGSPGTNQLARAIVTRLGGAAQGAVICRHQLFVHPRVPYTSKNGSASIRLPHTPARLAPSLADVTSDVMLAWFVPGSDPGLCVTPDVPEALHAFGRRCQAEVIEQDEARALAGRLGVQLEGLGGTQQGVIGALAAVGLAGTEDDGRVVHMDGWPHPDTVGGAIAIRDLVGRGVDEVRRIDSGARVGSGIVDVGKRLRPNVRAGRVVLFVEPAPDGHTESDWMAVKL